MTQTNARCCGSPITCGAHDPARYRDGCSWPRPIDQPTLKDLRIENAIYYTMASFGMRLPVQHEEAGIGERIKLMEIMARHIARAVKEVTNAE